MQAVILAAGEGTRLRPLTRSRPKALVPVANTPILKYVIDALLENGIREIIVVVGYRKEHVIRYLNERDLPVRVVYQENQLGTAHALRCAEPYLRDRFLLLAGDNYIDAASITRIKNERNAVLVTNHNSPTNFGVVVARDGLVREIKEKPATTDGKIVSTGVYALDRSFFKYAVGPEIPDALQAMIHDGGRVVPVQAVDWQDAINPWDLLEMNTKLLARIDAQRAGTISRSSKLYGLIHIGKDSEIGPNTYIHGPVVIGDSCKIGPNCVILPNTSIGSRVKIEPLSYIAHSLVMDDVVIGSHSRVIDAVVGEGCRLADHTATWTSEAVFERDKEGFQKASFGAVLGDRVCSAPFTILKNCIIGNNVSIQAGNTTVTGVIPDDAVVI
ncbi:Bifunctional protein GlmU [anaerobic digester metagenome]